MHQQSKKKNKTFNTNWLIIFFCSAYVFAQDIKEEKPFAVVETIPQFEKCKVVPIELAKDCFNEQMYAHVRKYFYYPEDAIENDIEGRVSVSFVINSEGTVEIKTLNAPENSEPLIVESYHVIKKLPNFKPGTQKGEPVNVAYTIPIIFNLAGSKKEKNNTRITVYDFENIDQIPQFTTCNDTLSSQAKRCFFSTLDEHIEKNLKNPIRLKKNEPEIIVKTSFIINEDGEISYVSGKSTNNLDYKENNKLIEAVKKTVAELPKFKPGVKDNKPVKTLVGDYIIRFSNH